MNKKRWVVGVGFGLALSVMLVGCSGGDEGMTGPGGPDNEVSVTVSDTGNDIGELVNEMRTFDNVDEFERKLFELGLEGPTYRIEDVKIEGDGEDEFFTNIDTEKFNGEYIFVVTINAYLYNGEYLVVYEKDGKIVQDLPETMGANVWEKDEFEAFLDMLSEEYRVTKLSYD